GSRPAAAAPTQQRDVPVSDQDRAHWAFRPVQRPDVPGVAAKRPLDAFIQVQLDRKGLKPNAEASPRELVRRIYFDLIGLPPSPAEVAAFEKDPSNAATSAG